MLFFLFLAPVFTCNQAKFRRGQVTPPYPFIFPSTVPCLPPAHNISRKKFPHFPPCHRGSFNIDHIFCG